MAILDDLDIILSETLPIVAIYAVYALIVCSIIQYVQYKNEVSELGFTGVFTVNITVFFTSLTVLFFILLGGWYGARVLGSEVLYFFVSAFLFIAVTFGASLLMQKSTGLIFERPMLNAAMTALFLSLPTFIPAIYFMMLSGADFRH